MGDKNLLILIAILLLGILVVLVIQGNQRTPGEKIADSIGEVAEEIGDEIDDHTTRN